MRLYLKPCDQSNRAQLEALEVFDTQKRLIESNVDSLKEADQIALWHPVGLYVEELPVGFAMYGLDQDDGTVWLDRFMIAAEFQGNGYGSRFLSLIIQKMVEQYHCEKIYLSYLPANTSAAHFYTRLGFQETGEIDIYGELIMCLVLDFPARTG